MTDWYERRNELAPGQVFVMHDGAVVKLDRTVPGDGTAWYVCDWWGSSWSYMDSHIEPGDLDIRLADDFDGHIEGRIWLRIGAPLKNEG